MIAPPNRPAPRSTLCAAVSAATPDDAAPDPWAPESALAGRIAALVTRAVKSGDDELARQREAFDQITSVEAESEREINALRDLAMDQMKQDDAILKKWIELI